MKEHGYGIVFLISLTVVFITLKLCHAVTWGWWLVFSPIWIGVILYPILFLIELLLERRK